jgi:flagellum-specific ATP synthase
VLSRELAAQNHYPAIDVLSSVSRVMTEIVGQDQLQAAGQLRRTLATYRDARDLINIGAYARGSNPDIDAAIGRIDEVNAFLRQGVMEVTDLDGTAQRLGQLFGT